MSKIFEYAMAISASLHGNIVSESSRATRNLLGLKNASQKLAEEYKRAAEVQAKNAQQIMLNRNYHQQLGNLLKNGIITNGEYRTSLNGVESEYRKLIHSADYYGQKLNDIQKAQKQNAAQQLNTHLRNTRDSFMSQAINIAGTAGIIKGTMVSPLVDAAQAAIKFESAMADVKKVVDFDTPKQFKEMNADILALTSTLPMAAEDIAKIVAAGGQSGIAREDLMSFAESAAKMGVAFDVTAEQAGDMMAKWRTAFKMNQAEVVSLADKVNYLGNTTAAAAPLISDVVTRIGPLGEVGGVASGEIAALGASMVGVGIPSEVAATGIKNMILSMVAGTSATKSQNAAFTSLGMSATDVAQRMQTDAKGAILDVLNAIQQLDEAEQAATLKELFGSESLSAIAPLLSNLDNLKNNLDKVADASQYAGSMEAEYAARSATTENQLQLTKNAFDKVAISIGSALLPAISSGAQVMAQYAGVLADVAGEHPALITGLVGIAGGMAGLVVAGQSVALVTSSIQALSAAYTFLRTTQMASTVATMASTIATNGLTMAQTAGRMAMMGLNAIMPGMRISMLLLNAAMAANPAGLIVTGLVALTAAGVALCTHFQEVQAFMASMWESPAAAILAFATGPVGILIYTASGIIANWEEVKSWFTTLWDDPSTALDIFVSFFTGRLQSLWATAQEYWSKISDVLGSGPSSGGPASMAPVMQNARGGIYHKGAFLTTFAEEGPEAAIPLDGSKRARDLWYTAGNIMGLIPDTVAKTFSTGFSQPDVQSNEGNFWNMLENFPASPSTINNRTENNSVSQPINISIPVTVNGNADSQTVNDIQSSIENTIRKVLRDIESHQRRVSFA